MFGSDEPLVYCVIEKREQCSVETGHIEQAAGLVLQW